MNFDRASSSLMSPAGQTALSQIFAPLQGELGFRPGRERGARRKSLRSWGAKQPGAETDLSVLLLGGQVCLRTLKRHMRFPSPEKVCGLSLRAVVWRHAGFPHVNTRLPRKRMDPRGTHS